MGWELHATRMRKLGNAYIVLMQKPEEKRSRGRSEDIIK
jgi:hypothetical protein